MFLPAYPEAQNPQETLYIISLASRRISLASSQHIVNFFRV